MTLCNHRWVAACLLLLLACSQAEGWRGQQWARHWNGLKTTDTAPRQQLLEVAASADAGNRGALRAPLNPAALATCTTFACLREQHGAAVADSSSTQFNFPHFLLVGWQKSASTALHEYLVRHPQVLAPKRKEPHFFTFCGTGGCTPRKQKGYLLTTLRLKKAVEAGLQLATFEGSADYAQSGEQLAPLIRDELPWVRVVASMREPISRAISLLNHHHQVTQQQGSSTIAPGPPCLQDNDAYTCLKRFFTGTVYGQGFYAPALTAWLDAFPSGQLFVLQYENLTRAESQPLVLADLQRFLGLDPSLPLRDPGGGQEDEAAEGGEDSEGADEEDGADDEQESDQEEEGLQKANVKRSKEGYPIQRAQYQAIVDLVRPDAERVAQLLASRGGGGGAPWLKAWEGVWESNLAACSQEGECRIQVS